MKHYVNFDYVVSTMKNGGEIELDGKTLSFDGIDVVTTCYAVLYTEVAEMHGYDRQAVSATHGFHIYRAVRCLVNDLYKMVGKEPSDGYNVPDKYTRLVYNLLEIGIAPTPALYNILMNTGIGLMGEKCYSVGDGVLMVLSHKSTDYYKVINNDFFENFVTFENMEYTGQIENITGVKVPDNLFGWLSRYEWNSAECEYIWTHFKAFCNKYEKELLPND